MKKRLEKLQSTDVEFRLLSVLSPFPEERKRDADRQTDTHTEREREREMVGIGN